MFFFSFGAFAQENFVKHKISQGENLSVIAKKYGVKVKDIADANPNAPKILKLNSVLLIPNKNKSTSKAKTKSAELAVNSNPSNAISSGTHEVAAKETLWGISKKYNVSVDDLKKANPLLETEGLKIGQQIAIPSKDVSIADKSNQQSVPEIVPTDVELFREVKAKETKYGISKEYGVSVAELERQNPSIKRKMPIGYLLKIRVPKEKADAIQAAQTGKINTETAISSSTQIAEMAPEIKKDSTSVRIPTGAHSDLIDQLIASATENIGTRYRSGGTTKAGFDCSGLMFCTFGNFDIKLPRSSIEQSRIGTKVASDEAQKGDLIFFKTNGRRHINHVGMVVENIDGEIKFVHSSTHGGVMISSTKEPYYTRSFSQVNRVLE
nr:NlpC/P60 family protein [Flavobacterium crocinum]